MWWVIKLWTVWLAESDLYGFIVSLLFKKKQAICLKIDSAGRVWALYYILISNLQGEIFVQFLWNFG